MAAKDSYDIAQERSFVAWINTHLKKGGDERITAIKDLTKWSTWIRFLTLLTKKQVNDGKYNKAPKTSLHERANIELGFEHVKKEGVRVTCGTTDFVEGNEKMILGIIWMLISKYQLADNMSAEALATGVSMTEDMLHWVQSTLKSYPIEITSFKTSFSDGKVFFALCEQCDPTALPFSTVGSDAMENLARAFQVAEEKLAIPPLLSPEHVHLSPDPQSIVTYVSYFRGYINARKKSAVDIELARIAEEAELEKLREIQREAIETFTAEKEAEKKELVDEFTAKLEETTARLEVERLEREEAQRQLDEERKKTDEKMAEEQKRVEEQLAAVAEERAKVEEKAVEEKAKAEEKIVEAQKAMEARLAVLEAQHARTLERMTFMKEGPLEKKGQNRHSWKRRWFQLKGAMFLYFEGSDSSGKAKGSIELEGTASVEIVAAPGEFRFAVNTKERQLLLRARTDAERNEWVDAIRLVCGVEGPSSGSTPSSPSGKGPASALPDVDLDPGTIKQGYLEKKPLTGLISTAWKSRWFMLRSDSMSYFDKPPEKGKPIGEPRGFMDLRAGFTAKALPDSQLDIRATLATAGKDGRLLLRAGSTEDRDAWLSALMSNEHARDK